MAERRDEAHDQELPHDLGLLFEALRGEFNAKIATLKAWGVAMCLGGGTLGGVIAKLVAPGATSAALRSVSSFFGLS